jgi:hypothetical protein
MCFSFVYSFKPRQSLTKRGIPQAFSLLSMRFTLIITIILRHHRCYLYHIFPSGKKEKKVHRSPISIRYKITKENIITLFSIKHTQSLLLNNELKLAIIIIYSKYKLHDLHEKSRKMF